MRVLVVEDHRETLDLVTRALQRDGHATLSASNAAEARARLSDEPADLIVLDLGLPDESGISLCRALRAEGLLTPVLILTAQGAISQRVAGFDAGADDFVAKPFALAELLARVRALGRRGPMTRSLVVHVADVTLDLAARRAARDGAEVPLTAREWAVIELLAARGGRLVSRADILESVWGDDSPQASASLDVIVGRIRRKLGAGCLRTVRGEGYSLGGS